MAIWTTILSFMGCKPKSNDTNTEMIDVNNILMTLPTIENTLPSAGYKSKDTFDLEILEDDWRQIELISADYLDLIKQEIDSINTIIENESIEVDSNMIAFKNLHVRKLIPEPIRINIDLETLSKSFKNIKIGSLSFYGVGKVIDGIYFNTSKIQLYGLVENNKVSVIGLYGLEGWQDIQDFRADMKAFMIKEKLVLVDWRSRLIIDSNGFDDYLKPDE